MGRKVPIIRKKTHRAQPPRIVKKAAVLLKKPVKSIKPIAPVKLIKPITTVIKLNPVKHRQKILHARKMSHTLVKQVVHKRVKSKQQPSQQPVTSQQQRVQSETPFISAIDKKLIKPRNFRLPISNFSSSLIAQFNFSQRSKLRQLNINIEEPKSTPKKAVPFKAKAFLKPVSKPVLKPVIKRNPKRGQRTRHVIISRLYKKKIAKAAKNRQRRQNAKKQQLQHPRLKARFRIQAFKKTVAPLPGFKLSPFKKLIRSRNALNIKSFTPLV